MTLQHNLDIKISWKRLAYWVSRHIAVYSPSIKIRETPQAGFDEQAANSAVSGGSPRFDYSLNPEELVGIELL